MQCGHGGRSDGLSLGQGSQLQARDDRQDVGQPRSVGHTCTVAYYFTIPALGPGKATLISNTYVVIAALMAAWFLRESLSGGKLAGNALAIVGLALLLAPSSKVVSFGWYEGAGRRGALAAAGTVIVIRELTRTESTAMIYTSQCIYVLAGSLPFALVELRLHPLS